MALAVNCLYGAGIARAQSPELRLFQNPPELQAVAPERLPGQVLVAPRTPSPTPLLHDVTYDLDVDFTDTEVLNPYTGGYDKVHLRSYNRSLIAPTISVYPSQTVRIRLHNKLKAESETDCPAPDARMHGIPSCLSTTNLHFHGLHVSPTGNSDNVLLQIAPGENFDYEINIPSDHPAGTFWYHSHRHGSTAAQVSSGMAGALIVRGRRTLAERAQNGGVADIDTILKQPNGDPINETILLFEQLAYACIDKTLLKTTNEVEILNKRPIMVSLSGTALRIR
jgi:FtsP/CotA-like multicopper oxidase with cupredoxin domain